MNVASLELCKELDKLTKKKWRDTDYTYYANAGQHSGTMEHRSMVFDKPANLPAYDLGYLLRKLPSAIKHSATAEDIDLGLGWSNKEKNWEANYSWSSQPTAKADTPEDAVCKLAIELFKQGILK